MGAFEIAATKASSPLRGAVAHYSPKSPSAGLFSLTHVVCLAGTATRGGSEAVNRLNLSHLTDKIFNQ